MRNQNNYSNDQMQNQGYRVKIFAFGQQLPEANNGAKKTGSNEPVCIVKVIYLKSNLCVHFTLHLGHHFFSDVVWCRCIVRELHGGRCTA